MICVVVALQRPVQWLNTDEYIQAKGHILAIIVPCDLQRLVRLKIIDGLIPANARLPANTANEGLLKEVTVCHINVFILVSHICIVSLFAYS